MNKKVLSRGLLAIACLLTSLSAYAGTYQASYGGGTISYYGDVAGSGSFPYPGGVIASTGDEGWDVELIDCSGEITTTFTWVPSYSGEPTPPFAVVKESSEAWIDCIAGSASCTSGIAGETSTVTTVGSRTWGTKTGTRYTLKTNPGSSFTVTCSPEASASTFLLGAAGAGVEYSAIAYPIKLNLAGILNADTDKRLLIGQKLQGTVSLGGFTPGSASYAWTVSGGDPFASYTAGSTADYTAWSAPATTSNTASAFFAKPATVTMSCAVTTTSPALSFTLTQTATSVAPTLTHIERSIGSMQLRPNTTSPTEFTLWGATHSRQPDNSSLPRIVSGVYYDFWVEQPAAWTTLGKFAAIQLITDNSRVTFTDNTTQYANTIHTRCLDEVFPYTPWVNSGPRVLSGPTFVQTVIFSDRPRFPSIDADYKDMVYEADFELYIFFDAPNNGIGKTYVPLQLVNWDAKGSAHRGTPWTASDDGSGWGATSPYPAHPEWTDIIH